MIKIKANSASNISLSPLVDAKSVSHERWYTIFLQVLFPFFIAGFGMVGAGVVLDKVQVMIFYKKISNSIYSRD